MSQFFASGGPVLEFQQGTLSECFMPLADIVALFFSRSVVSDSFVTTWTVACQTPLSVGFPRQE